MKKILHIVRNMSRAGAETFIMNLYRNIDRKKYKFIILCHSTDKGDYDDEIIKLGGKLVYVKNNKYNFIKYIKEIKKIIKDEQIDVIHSHVGLFSGIYCWIGKKCNVNVRIAHSHTSNRLVKKSFFNNLYKFIMKKMISQYSTKCLACGDLAGKFMFCNDYEIIHNGIDIKKFKPIDITSYKKELNIDDEIIIGHIGRFSEVKNHNFFIPLALELKNQNIKFKIVLVGDGKLKDNIMNQVKANNLTNKFIFTGVRSDVEKFIHIFDVLVMPSLYEGFPITVIEAMAAGVPCILSDTITSEVAIVPNACSFLNINEDVKKWVKKIIEYSSVKFDCYDNWKYLNENNFAIEKVVKRIEEIYDGGR